MGGARHVHRLRPEEAMDAGDDQVELLLEEGGGRKTLRCSPPAPTPEQIRRQHGTAQGLLGHLQDTDQVFHGHVLQVQGARAAEAVLVVNEVKRERSREPATVSCPCA
jgi:hypothetical protein